MNRPLTRQELNDWANKTWNEIVNQEDIIAMAREAGFERSEMKTHWVANSYELERFAALVAAAKDEEHKEAMRWDVHSCGPTCKRYACVAIREAVAVAKAEEREACAKVCESEADMFKSCAYGANDGRYDWKEDAARECAATTRERSANERARGETK